MKKFLSIVLVLAVVFSFAACGNNENPDSIKEEINSQMNLVDDNIKEDIGDVEANRNHFLWSDVDSTVIVGLSDSGSKQTELIIPADCTLIDTAFENTVVKKVKFENPDTILNNSVFKSCTALEYIELPMNMTEIGKNLFFECTSLKSITIPANVTEIKANAFEGCIALEEVVLGDKLQVIDREAFYNCSSLKSMVIPETVTELGRNVFAGCLSMGSLKLNAHQIIGEYAFSDCDALETIDVPEGVTEIGDGAFAYCDILESVTIPASVQSIGSNALANAHTITLDIVKGSYVDQNLSGMVGASSFNVVYSS